MKKFAYFAIASTFALAACDDMMNQPTTTTIDYSNQTCEQLESLAVEKAEMAGIAHQNDNATAAQAVVGTVGGVAASAPIAGMALTAGAIASDQEDVKVDQALKSQYDAIVATMSAKGCM